MERQEGRLDVLKCSSQVSAGQSRGEGDVRELVGRVCLSRQAPRSRHVIRCLERRFVACHTLVDFFLMLRLVKEEEVRGRFVTPTSTGHVRGDEESEFGRFVVHDGLAVRVRLDLPAA